MMRWIDGEIEFYWQYGEEEISLSLPEFRQAIDLFEGNFAAAKSVPFKAFLIVIGQSKRRTNESNVDKDLPVRSDISPPNDAANLATNSNRTVDDRISGPPDRSPTFTKGGERGTGTQQSSRDGD